MKTELKPGDIGIFICLVVAVIGANMIVHNLAEAVVIAVVGMAVSTGLFSRFM